MRFLVIGATGLMGSTFTEMVPDSLGVDEKTLDITDKDAVFSFFEKRSKEFDVVLNYAAFTNVDAAEKERGDEKGLVWRLNVEGPRNLAEASGENGKYLIHISTDFVFDGTPENPGPYKEDSSLPETAEGLGWYGWTKNRGEVAVGQTSENTAIVRTAYPFRVKEFEMKKDYAHGIVSLYEEKKLYPMFTDQRLNVTFLDDQIEALQTLAETKRSGVYHVVNTGLVSPYEFATYLLEKYSGKKVEVEKGSMEEFLKAPGRTPRPRLGGLDTTRTQSDLGINFRNWKEAVDEFVLGVKKTS